MWKNFVSINVGVSFADLIVVTFMACIFGKWIRIGWGIVWMACTSVDDMQIWFVAPLPSTQISLILDEKEARNYQNTR